MTSMKDKPAEDPFSDDDADTETDPSDESPDSSSDRSTSAQPYPYVLRRDTVKDERTNDHVALLRDEYSQAEEQIIADIADEMGLSASDLSVFDLREALYELGKRHPDELTEILLEWGYDGKI